MERPWIRRGFVAAVVVTHVILLVIASRQWFVTVDESGHIPAGLHHWQHGTFELYRVNPPLPRMIATLPIWFAEPNLEMGILTDKPGRRLEWIASNEFAKNNQDRYVELVRTGRWAGIVWSLLGAGLVMRWSSELFGDRAGLLALVLWCFGPNILAYSALVTPDIPCTVSGLAACYVFRKTLHNPTWAGAWFSGLILGIALLTRVTWVLFFALWPVMGLLYLWQRPIGPRKMMLRGAQLAVLFVVGIVVLNLGYGFRGTGAPLGAYRFVSKSFAGDRSSGTLFGNRFQGTVLERVPVPLPSDYLLGMDLQRLDFEAGWQFYMNGKWETGGRWYFYAYALLLKIPLGNWLLFLLAIYLIVRGRSVHWREEMLHWLPALSILVLVSSQTGLNYFRYILPMLPLVLIGISRCAILIDRTRWKHGLLVICSALAVVASSLQAYPHCLSYMNEIAGGSSNGYRYLADSNLDWGQDLIRLKHWLDDHPQEKPIGLAYFNFVDPAVIGIQYDLPPLGPIDRNADHESPPSSSEVGPRPGRFAVSVFFVQGGNFYAPNGHGGGTVIPLHGYAYFQHFQPVAKAGLTIWIYDLSLTEVNEVRRQMGLAELNEQDRRD